MSNRQRVRRRRIIPESETESESDANNVSYQSTSTASTLGKPAWNAYDSDSSDSEALSVKRDKMQKGSFKWYYK